LVVALWNDRHENSVTVVPRTTVMRNERPWCAERPWWIPGGPEKRAEIANLKRN